MKPYRTITTVVDPKKLVLEDLPFSSGEQVEIVIRPHRPGERKLDQELRELLKETQNLPHVQDITEEDIDAEIDAYRSGR